MFELTIKIKIGKTEDRTRKKRNTVSDQWLTGNMVTYVKIVI